MALVTVQSWTGSPPGINVYAYPLSSAYPIAQWLTHRVLLPDQEGSRPITLDDAKGLYWGLFEGDAQPTSKTMAVATVSLEESVTEFPVGLTVAIPSVLENAGYDPTRIVRYRGTTWIITIEDLGVLDNVSEVWFTLRKRQSDDEAESIVQASLTGGLLISNAAPATSTNGTLVISDDTTGIIVITVKAVETQNYPVGNNFNYDIKVRRNSGDVELIHKSSKFDIQSDITRKISNA